MNISTEGDIIYFPNFSMTQGATFLVTVDVRNAGPATGTISSPAISGLVDSATNKTVMTCVPQNSYPLVLAKDSTATLIFNCYLVNAGTCNPRLDFNLT